MPYVYDFPKCDLTADFVVFREREFRELDVLLIVRGGEPFKGCLAFPGGYIHSDHERIFDGAIRELREETSINARFHNPQFVGFYDDPSRDKRGRVITFVYTCIVPKDIVVKAMDDAVEFVWVPCEDALSRELAFDHSKILRDALDIQVRKFV